ncbi:hypothetical protein M758_2G030100 [Ceratodon purpureus]|nr:hypothetical protein M758_2G030100 [Ceratodon purpureus]
MKHHCVAFWPWFSSRRVQNKAAIIRGFLLSLAPLQRSGISLPVTFISHLMPAELLTIPKSSHQPSPKPPQKLHKNPPQKLHKNFSKTSQKNFTKKLHKTFIKTC